MVRTVRVVSKKLFLRNMFQKFIFWGKKMLFFEVIPCFFETRKKFERLAYFDMMKFWTLYKYFLKWFHVSLFQKIVFFKTKNRTRNCFSFKCCSSKSIEKNSSFLSRNRDNRTKAIPNKPLEARKCSFCTHIIKYTILY